MPEFWIENILKKFCVPTDAKGYLYLSYIITLQLTYTHIEMPVLYNQIALSFGVSVPYAKRKMREAIMIGYMNSDKTIFRELAGIFCKDASRIRVQEFILAVAILAKTIDINMQTKTNENYKSENEVQNDFL